MTKDARTIACDHFHESRHPVYWNPFNKVVQCHKCGTIFIPSSALESYGKEQYRSGFQAGVRGAANICQRYIDGPYTADTATEAENMRNNILALLPKEEERN